MRVTDSGHGVQLEVLVRTDGRGLLDGAPVCEGWLRIVEVLVAELADEGCIGVRDTLGDLRAGHAATSLADLLSDLVVLLSGGLLLHQIVPHGVSGSYNLNLVNEVSVESRGGKTDPVHLTDKDFVSEKPRSPETAVRVGKVIAGLSCHIDKLTKSSLSGVVLLIHIIEMLSVFLDVVVADHVSEQME